MRGSPLLRTLAVLAALLLTGLGLAALTTPSKPVPSPPPTPAEAPPSSRSARFQLLLSAEARDISLEAGGEAVSGQSASSLSGKLEIPGKHPVVLLRVGWTDRTAGHRFAKLRLEIPGQETREHVFHAPGDIDDIWEP